METCLIISVRETWTDESVTEARTCFVEVSIDFVGADGGLSYQKSEDPVPEHGGGASASRTVRRVPQHRGSPVSPSQFSAIC